MKAFSFLEKENPWEKKNYRFKEDEKMENIILIKPLKKGFWLSFFLKRSGEKV